MELGELMIFFPLDGAGFVDYAEAKMHRASHMVAAQVKAILQDPVGQKYLDILRKTKAEKRPGRIQPANNIYTTGSLLRNLAAYKVFGEQVLYPCNRSDESCLARYAELRYHVLENVEYVKCASSPWKSTRFHSSLSIIYEEEQNGEQLTRTCLAIETE